MASTYVNDLRIEEQATGENSGTWGTKVNSAFSQIAEAFSYGTKQLAADANETFTMPDGTSDGTRSLYLKITSAGSLTATRTVTLGPNTVSKLWIIENATTGSQSITIAQGSGGTVTIPTGAVKMVYSDGAGAGAAVVDALVDLDLTGTTKIATANIDGGSIDGTTIGASTAAAGTFTSVIADGLTVDGGSGNATINFTPGTTYSTIVDFSNASSDFEIVSFGSGSASADNFRIRDNGVSRFNIAGNGDISFYEDTGTTAKLVWKATDERLGIGTSPAEKLHVAGAIATTAGISGHGANRATFSQEGANGAFIQSYGADTSTMGAFTFRQASSDFSVNAIPLTISATGNVGIGVSSLVTGSTRRVLQVSTGSDGGQLALADSTTEAANPRIFATNKEDLKLSTANTATGTIQFITGSTPTERMRIDSSGNVGINTASPNSYAGYTTLTIDNATNGGLIDFESNGTRVSTFFGNASQTNFGTVTATPLVLLSNNTERMRIDSSGNVGIGVVPTSGWSTSPYNVLDINTSSVAASSTTLATSLNAYNDGSTWRYKGTGVASQYYQASGNHVWQYAASGTAGNAISFSEAMRIDSSGAVIINNSGGDAQLYLGGTSGTNRMYLARSGNDSLLWNVASGVVRFGTNNTEAMRLDASGNLLVGTTSAAATAGIGTKIIHDAAAPYISTVGSSSTNGVYGYYLYSTGAGAFRCYIGYGGTIYATSTSITAISDASLKENVRDLDKGLDTILALKPRRFDWKNGDGNDIMGFVAQEVQEVLPELVHDYQYNETETKLGLKMGDMLPSLVKAIQEQQDLIESLTARIAALEGAN